VAEISPGVIDVGSFPKYPCIALYLPPATSKKTDSSLDTLEQVASSPIHCLSKRSAGMHSSSYSDFSWQKRQLHRLSSEMTVIAWCSRFVVAVVVNGGCCYCSV